MVVRSENRNWTLIDTTLSQGAQEFRSPSYGPDWVLVVEDANAGYGPPGLTPITT